MSTYVAVTVFFAALFALTGTNAQARLAREALFSSEDALIAAAGRMWRPIGWLGGKRYRQARRAAEAAVRSDVARWEKYQRLCSELRSWNALESSVALGLGAAVVAGLQSVLG